ncbi:flagellar basal-body rod protein FlgB [Sulfurivirga caldicuralii]|uniref:Flagellar basal body rod protein FlgB n=1 Tax=Sulfurivirga caldicuralii TaxID=364032 RepID=A0A1N6E5C1_9GAMM|nr:flagellar basal body rod protein FlgB [Sulfurivirga caldicuralii]SIN78255.1 flagellar basal-body rod protein FlgB [Sulfurivirga caldicuralii]
MAHSLFGIHEQALQVRSERAKLLAQNLANADTPNYKARDIDWRGALTQAQQGLKSEPPVHLARTNSRHIDAQGEPMDGDSFVKYRMPTQPSLDGNTVEPHIEKAQFMENAIQYQTTLEFINGRIKGIRNALRGGN